MRFSAFIIILLFLGCKQSSNRNDFLNQSNAPASSQVTTTKLQESAISESQEIITPTPDQELFLVESIKEDGIISLEQNEGFGLARVLDPVHIKVATTDQVKVKTHKSSYIEVESIEGLRSLRPIFADHKTNFQISFKSMKDRELQTSLQSKILPRENILCNFKSDTDAQNFLKNLKNDREIDSSVKIEVFRIDSTTSPKSYIFKIKKVLTDKVASDFFEKKGFKLDLNPELLDPKGRIFTKAELSALIPGYLAEKSMRILPAEGMDFRQIQNEVDLITQLLKIKKSIDTSTLSLSTHDKVRILTMDSKVRNALVEYITNTTTPDFLNNNLPNFLRFISMDPARLSDLYQKEKITRNELMDVVIMARGVANKMEGESRVKFSALISEWYTIYHQNEN